MFHKLQKKCSLAKCWPVGWIPIKTPVHLKGTTMMNYKIKRFRVGFSNQFCCKFNLENAECAVTVAILAQGTDWAVAPSQAF